MRLVVACVIFIPLALIVGIFAIENRSPLRIEVWPFEVILELWTSVWILGVLAIGIVIGLVIGWMSGVDWRRRARRAERRLRNAEDQLPGQKLVETIAGTDLRPDRVSLTTGSERQPGRAND